MRKFFVLLIVTIFLATSFTKIMHPYHVGSLEFNFSQKSKTFEVSGKFFMDDLESALNQKYGTSLHFGDEKFKAQINENLRRYCLEYLRLKSDNQFVKINYLGYEEDRENVNIYLETEPLKAPKKVEVSASFLYNFFDDQMNIIHIIVDGNRKSERLTYPNRYLFQNF